MGVAFTLQALAGVDVHQGHGATPDATSVERKQTRLVALAFERRPVAEDDLQAFGLALLVGEPRRITRRCGVDAFLALEIKLAVTGAKSASG